MFSLLGRLTVFGFVYDLGTPRSRGRMCTEDLVLFPPHQYINEKRIGMGDINNSPVLLSDIRTERQRKRETEKERNPKN